MTEQENYPLEGIPDEDTLFLRIHKTKIDKEEPDVRKRIMLLAFDPQPKGSTQMSTDWSKYSTAKDSQMRARVPEDNGIVSFTVSRVRQKPYPLTVQHDPILTEQINNRSHAFIFEVPPRKNDIGIRLKLRDICQWEIEV